MISGDKAIVNQLNDSEDKIIKYLMKYESVTNKQAREVTEDYRDKTTVVTDSFDFESYFSLFKNSEGID